MSHFRYSAACKLEAVRRVVEDGCSVCEVAREAGVSEGSLFFWVRRYRQFVQRARVHSSRAQGAGSGPRSQQEAAPACEVGTLVAYLRRASTG